MSRLHDWFTTLRAANLPTVWSNVALGAGLAGASTITPAAMATVVGGVSCIYLAGMAMNDAMDVGFDRSNASERPVAAGHITPVNAMAVGLVLLILGWCLLALPATAGSMVQLASVLLIACVSLYQWIHRACAWAAAVLMAGCRALVPIITAATLVDTLPTAVWIAAAATAIWTVGITLLGRGERGGERLVPTGPAWLMAAAIGIPLVAVVSPGGDFAAAAAGLLIVCIAWIPAVARRARAGARGQAVLWGIAGIGVLDAGVLLAAGLPGWSAISMICAATALGAQRLGGGT